VELALVLPALVLVVLALVEVVAVARVQIELLGAAREGARVAATNPDPADAVAAVQSVLRMPMSQQVRVRVIRPAVVGRLARVELVLAHRLAAPFLGGVPLSLRASASMRVER